MAGRVDLLRGIFSVLGVARAGSFRRAMTDSRVGFRRLNNDVLAVEKALGVLLFHRTSDGVVLTPEGKTVVEHATKIENTLTEILRLGRGMGEQNSGEVMLAVTEGLGTFWVAPRLHAFRENHPGVTIGLHSSMALADMRRFEIDLALQVVPPTHPELIRMRLGTLHLMLAASSSYIEQHGMPKTVEALHDHFFVFNASPQLSDRHLVERAIGKPLRRDRFIVMRNSSAHYWTVEHGEGIGFLPTYGFAIGAKVKPINLPIRYSLDIWLCFHEQSRSIKRVSAAIDWLTAIFDPRLYPWFRREFVPPAKYDAILDEQGSRPLVERFSFKR